MKINFIKKSAVVSALLLSATDPVQAAGGSLPYSYLQNGADWPNNKAQGDWQCHYSNQSPIDLRTDAHSNPFEKADGAELEATYANMVGATVLNKGMVVQVNFPDATAAGTSPNNYFESEHSRDELGGALKYSAAQFHFHAKSEHTIDGKRYDMEMHTVHLAENDGSEEGRRRLAESEEEGTMKIWASAMGIMFDRYDYDPTVTAEEREVVDKFFDALGFDTAPQVHDGSNHVVLAADANVNYGDLTKLVNFANRWVYTGSLTTPPCTVGVYFQVVDRVLPISEKHYQAYLAHQQKYVQESMVSPTGEFVKAGDVNNEYSKGWLKQTLDVTGNWRVTNLVDNHNVRYMRANLEEELGTVSDPTGAILGVLLAFLIVLALVFGYSACNQVQADNGEKPYDAVAEQSIAHEVDKNQSARTADGQKHDLV